MVDLDPPRGFAAELVAEFVGTGLLVTAVVGSGVMAAAAPAAVGAYIGAAYWFTSSTSFANPAVTVGRAFTDTFTGIAPASVPGYLAAQLVGVVVAVGLLAVLYPAVERAADEVVVPHEIGGDATGHSAGQVAGRPAGRRQ